MPSALSNEPLHSLHQDNQNGKHDFFGHVTKFGIATGIT